MTLEEARELLGKQCEDVSDDQLKEEIETATLLKNMFFDMLKSGKLNKSK